MTSLHRRRSALPVFTVLALGTTLALAGCATTDTAEEAVEATDTAAAQAAPERVASGVTGEIADVADGLMQVQDTESQTAVSYTDDTTITAQVSGSLSDLEVGDCVFVTTDAADATVATLVTVTAAVDGECGIAGFAAGGGAPADGAAPGGDARGGGAAPEGEAPADAPVGAGEGGAPTGFAAVTTGAVTAVDASGFTVEATGRDDATTSTTLSVTEATSIVVTVDADASVLVVGKCVTAQGEADTSGGYAATALVVSEPGDEGCSARTAVAGGQQRPDAGADR